ncbi:PREDICTED: protein virilizer homolog [Priapulus caudatus]|uniref:Protein virilizer homolog n=1 Tax=Priapulus caudatus TaxID=37621 RepID=A0ABM1EIH9_PRICU|nr:PREDICTED: protein virilizer homolog [Priapulus caudatus]
MVHRSRAVQPLPLRADRTTVLSLVDPSLSRYEVEKRRQRPHGFVHSEEASKLKDILKVFGTAEHTEKWVEAMESIPGILTPALVSLEAEDLLTDVLSTLIDWTFEGLDFEKAIAQPSAVHKVRHMKCGVKMAEALCATCGAICKRMLDRGVVERLLDLYHEEYMSLPGDEAEPHRLALDELTQLGLGLDSFLGYETASTETASTETASAETGYQRVLQMLFTTKATRLKVALMALVQKCHFYEVLVRLEKTVNHSVEASLRRERSQAVAMETDAEDAARTMSEADADTVITCMDEIAGMLVQAPHVIAQCRRSLPAKVMFEAPPPSHDPYPGLFSLLKARRALRCVLVALTSVCGASHARLFSAAHELLVQLTASQRGCLAMLCEPAVANALVRTLLQTASEYSREDAEEMTSQQLGLQLVLRLHSIQLIDELLKMHTVGGGGAARDLDSHEALDCIKVLYSLTYTPLGRAAVVLSLSQGLNLQALIPFIDTADDSEAAIVVRKSACAGYASSLIMMMVRYSEDISYLETFGRKLHNLCEQDAFTKADVLKEWILPVRRVPSLTASSAPEQLAKELKQYVEQLESLPPGVVTVLRMMKHACVPPTRGAGDGTTEELKYKYAIVQLFGHDVLSMLLTILQSISDEKISPWQQSASLVCGQMLVAMAIPLLAVLRHMLAYLIGSRGVEFRDLSALAALLRAHAALCCGPLPGVTADDAQRVQTGAVGVLLAFTQPTLQEVESHEALSGSLWTLMVREVLAFVLAAPRSIYSGVTLLAELLPLPLPIQTREQLSEEETCVAVNSRKLWGAHLHSLSALVQQTVRTLAPSTCQPLHHALRRVCVQLADLAAPTAMMIARAVADALLDSLKVSVKVAGV